MPHLNYDAADLAGVQAFAPTMGSDIRQDDSIFTARQLDYVKTQTYDKKLPPMQGLRLVPIATDVPEWAETVTYRVFDQFGIAKIIANYADDLPRADVKGTEVTVRVKDIGDSYGYNINELRASIATGTNLPTRKAGAARRAIEIKQNQIAMVGDPAYKLYGLLTHPNIGLTAGLNGDWLNPDTTADEILEDMDAMYNTVRTQSYGVHKPNTFALPTAQYSRVFSLRLANANGVTVGEFFMKKHPDIVLEEVPELAGASSNGKDIAIMYERNAENLCYDMVMAFNQLPAQPRNLELVVPCLARTAGVEVHYPLALTKGVIGA